MPKIFWKGIIKSEKDFPTAKLPQNAKKLDSEDNLSKLQIKALPFMIPSVLLCLSCMFIKTFAANEKVVSLPYLFIGIIIGFFLIIVHELLHAIAFPKNATVYIGIIPSNLTAVALSSSPVKRNRFIFLSLLPVILGIIPLILFCITSPSTTELNGLLFGIAIIGMTSVYPDFYNVYHILKVVPKNATIQNHRSETYYFE